jgi:hypothetical protein
MPHFVFANNNEIAAKSADGASIAASPDTCFSPGAPMPGVPVTYPNTCIAKDLGNLSKTVFLKGTGAALEDKSYFTTSYGDEPATPAMKKGLISTKIKGKCYFKKWSMNVKIEGLGVARHLDTVTHNHVNQPNALVQKYRSIFNTAAECAQDRNEVANKCKEKPQPPENDKPKIKKRRGFGKVLENIVEFPDEMAKDLYGYKRKAGKNAWIDDHCGGMWIKPANGADAFKKAKAQIAEINELLQKDTLTIIQTVFGDMLKMAYDQLGPWYVVQKAGGLALRSLLKNIVGGAAGTTGVGLVVTGAMAAWTVNDFISTASELAEKLGPLGKEYLDDLMDIDKLKKKAQEKLAEYMKDPQKAWADMMTAKAKVDPCLKARKCMLVPFNKTGAKTAANSGEGCCPGQTGHHVIPGAAFEGNPCYSSKDHRNAPTICVEGTNNSHGSHGAAHRELDQRIKAYKDKYGGKISYKAQRDKSVEAIRAAGASHCDPECLKKQLDEFYKDCDKGDEKNLKAHSGMGGKDAEDSGTGEISQD